jgi:hypothetical protein
MARDFFINGESLVLVKGRADSSIGTLSQLGLTDGPIRVRLESRYLEIQVDAWGSEIPAEVQYKLSAVDISMNLVHLDRDVLDVCLMESMGGAPVIGQTARAGARLGNGLGRFAAGGALGNHYIGLNITSPVASKPWRFFFTYLVGPPMEFPLGTERSIVTLNWRAIPYTTDPYGAGTGAYGASIWDYTLET